MTTTSQRPMLGAALLFGAATLWGIGFIAQKETVALHSPLWAMTLRFLVAAPIAVALAGRRLRAPGCSWRDAALLGVVLFGAYWLQTAALTRTPVARVALITGLYAAFVPFLAPLFGHPAPRRRHWIGVVIALAGMGALIGAGGASSTPWNSGDLMTLLHAGLGACHVLLVARIAGKADPFALNAMQLTALVLFALPVALLVEGPAGLVLPSTATAYAAFGYLALFSTVTAFLCQVAGQRHVSPSTAALLMLLETPVGAIATLLVFREGMSGAQGVGAIVLVVGVLVSLSAERGAEQRAKLDA